MVSGSADGQAMPEARDVLEALQISGVFEADGAVKPQVFAWDKPEKGKRRLGSVLSLVGLAALIALRAKAKAQACQPGLGGYAKIRRPVSKILLA